MKQFLTVGIWLTLAFKTALPAQVAVDSISIRLHQLIAEAQKSESLEIIDLPLDTLPATIWQLTHLKSLKIENVPIREIPDDISRLRNLERLTIRNTDITDLPNSIEQLGYLSVFEAGGTLNGPKLKQFPMSLTNLLGLKGIILVNTDIKALPQELIRLKKLEFLEVQYSPLESFQRVIYQLPLLKNLTLKAVQLKALPSGIGSLISLRTLILDENHLTVLPPDLVRLSSLEVLHLKNNPLERLPAGMSGLTRLNTLYLQGCHLEEMPGGWLRMPGLTSLGGSFSLVTQLSEMPKIRYLALRDTLASALDIDFSRLTNLRHFELWAPHLDTFPHGLHHLSNLSVLVLNPGPAGAQLPDTLWSLSHLSQLVLSGNNIAELPVAVEGLKGLQALLIEKTALTTLPLDVLPALPNLRYLYLIQNPDLVIDLQQLKSKLPRCTVRVQ